MSEPEGGPFKTFRMLWLPFSLPATVLGMSAWLVFFAVSACLGRVYGLGEADAAMAHFSHNVQSFVFTFALAPGAKTSLFIVKAAVALVLWATFGVAICRCFALRLTRDEYVGFTDALKFGLKHARTALLFPIIIASCIVVLAAVNAGIGAVLLIPYVGVVGYVLLPIAYIVSGFMLLIGLTAVFGLGMVSGAIAVEKRGALDAWGKALNFILMRPVHFLVYLVVTKVMVVDIVYEIGVERRMLHRWTYSSLTPFGKTASFRRIAEFSNETAGGEWLLKWIYWGIGGAFMLFLCGIVLSTALGAFTAMFLVLRRDVDGIDVSDIEIDAPTDVEPDPMPVPPAETGATSEAPAPAPDAAKPFDI